MRDELYINGQLMELSDTGINLNFVSSVFSDISKIASNYSQTIKLPKTTHNLKAIQGASIITSDSHFPYSLHRADVIRDGIMIISGASAYLLSVGDEIEFSIVWGNISALSDLVNDGLSLSDLPIEDYIEVGKDIPTLTPDIDWGATPSQGISVFNHPVIRVNKILSLISSKYNLTFEFPSNINDIIYWLAIPLTAENTSEKVNDMFENVFPLSNWGVNEYEYVAGGYIIGYVDSFSCPYYETPDYQSSPKIRSFKAIEKNIDAVIRYTFVLEAKSTDLSNKSFSMLVGDTSVTPIIEITGDTARLTYDGSVDVTLPVEGDIQLKVDSYDATVGYKVISGQLSVRPSIEDYREGAYYFFADNMPDIKILDFLKNLKAMFGLYVRNEGNTLFFEPYSRVTDTTSANNWSSRLVWPDIFDMEYSLSNIAQRNLLLYKEDETLKNNYDGEILVDNKALEREAELYESPFSGTDYRFPGANGLPSKAFIPIYTINENGEVEYNDVEPRILSIVTPLGVASATFDGLSWPDLIDKYYQEYIGFTNNTRIITTSMILSPADLANIDLYTPIYLSQYGSYFVIMEIKTKDNNLSDVKLLKL